MSIRDYVQQFAPPESQAKYLQLVRSTDAADIESQPTSASEHLPLSELEAGISSGRLFKSKIRVNRHYWAEGWVNVPGQDKEVLIRVRFLLLCFVAQTLSWSVLLGSGSRVHESCNGRRFSCGRDASEGKMDQPVFETG